MSSNVLFVQGGGKGAHEVDATLVAQLGRALGADYEIRYPLMPDEASPDYGAWKRAIAQELEGRDRMILVGHSVGASVLVRFLAGQTFAPPPRGIFLIAAPYIGTGGWQIEGFETPKDLAARIPAHIPVYLYHGRDDETVPFAHLGLYAALLPGAFVRPLDGRNHQLNDDASEMADDIRRVGEP